MVAITQTTGPTPTYIRLPRPGTRCPYCQLPRTTLAELIRPCKRNGFKPPVPAKELKAKGARRGIVLIPLADLLAYLGDLPSTSGKGAVQE